MNILCTIIEVMDKYTRIARDNINSVIFHFISHDTFLYCQISNSCVDMFPWINGYPRNIFFILSMEFRICHTSVHLRLGTKKTIRWIVANCSTLCFPTFVWGLRFLSRYCTSAFRLVLDWVIFIIYFMNCSLHSSKCLAFSLPFLPTLLTY